MKRIIVPRRLREATREGILAALAETDRSQRVIARDWHVSVDSVEKIAEEMEDVGHDCQRKGDLFWCPLCRATSISKFCRVCYVRSYRPTRQAIVRCEGPDDKAAYMPTEEQIAVACAEIRQGWSDEERERRAHGILPVEAAQYTSHRVGKLRVFVSV